MSQPYAWTQVTAEAAFQPRDGAGALSYAETMWLIGGWNPRHPDFPKTCVNDVWHSANGLDWTCIKIVLVVALIRISSDDHSMASFLI